MKLLRSFTFAVAAFMLLAASAFAQAPFFISAQRAGGAENDLGSSITLDNAGNCYVTGYFEGSVNFGNITLAGNLNVEMFTAKFDASMNVVWARRIDYSYAEGSGFGIVVDKAGNTYVAGRFYNFIPIGTQYLASKGRGDALLIKYDPQGNFLWARGAGGTEEDLAYSLALDNKDNVVIVGDFRRTATFDTNVVLSSNGREDIFVAKYSSAGSLIWAWSTGGAGGEHVSDVKIDGQGNLYLTGSFNGNSVIGSQSFPSLGNTDMFVAKFDSTGNDFWVRSGGGPKSDVSRAIAIDAAKNCYVTGDFQGTAIFDSMALSGSGYVDAFLLKYDSLGGLQWARSATGPSGEWTTCYTVATDSVGNSYMTGHFADTVKFGNSTFLVGGPSDIYLAKFDSQGNIVGTKRTGGSNSVEGTHDMAIDRLGQCYITGGFEGITEFDNITLQSAGKADMFVAKLGAFVGREEESENKLKAFPNPFSSTILVEPSASMRGTAEAILFDLLGREVHHEIVSPEVAMTFLKITPSATLQPGMYVLQLRQGDTFRQVRVCRQ